MLVSSLDLYLPMLSIVFFNIIGHHKYLHPIKDVRNCSILDFKYCALMEQKVVKPTHLNTHN